MVERLGVICLLDVEDVDVLFLDEKFVIIYVFLIYDVFFKVFEGGEGISVMEVDFRW